jgi:hypothetical protein
MSQGQSTQAQQSQPTQGPGTPTPVSLQKQLDRKLASLAGQIPAEWRTVARSNPELLAESILAFINGLDLSEYFLVEALAYAFGQVAKQDVLRKLASGDEDTLAAAFQFIIEDTTKNGGR